MFARYSNFFFLLLEMTQDKTMYKKVFIIKQK